MCVLCELDTTALSVVKKLYTVLGLIKHACSFLIMLLLYVQRYLPIQQPFVMISIPSTYICPITESAQRTSSRPEKKYLGFTDAILTLSMVRLPLTYTQGRNDSLKASRPCYVGIHWIALS